MFNLFLGAFVIFLAAFLIFVLMIAYYLSNILVQFQELNNKLNLYLERKDNVNK